MNKPVVVLHFFSSFPPLTPIEFLPSLHSSHPEKNNSPFYTHPEKKKKSYHLLFSKKKEQAKKREKN